MVDGSTSGSAVSKTSTTDSALLTDALESLDNLHLDDSVTKSGEEPRLLKEEEEPLHIIEGDHYDDAVVNAFTDEELYSILHSLIPEGEDGISTNHRLTQGNITDNDSPTLQLLQQPLEELPGLDLSRFGKSHSDSDDEGEDSIADFLQIPLQDFDGLFDSNPQVQTLTVDQEQAESSEDEAALELLDQLGNLTLDFQSPYPTHVFDEDKTSSTNIDFSLFNSSASMPHPKQTTDEFDDLPPYLFCQPCRSPSQEDDETLCLCCPPGTGICANQWNLPPLSDDFIDAYLSATGELPPTVARGAQEDDNNRERRTVHRPAAIRAARHLAATAFGVSLKETAEAPDVGMTGNEELSSPSLKPTPPSNKATTTSNTTERVCLGHKERILGLDLSECGTYLATASQDSTIRIWKVATNQLLATLTDHSSRFECLRVAWASSEWGEYMLDRSPGLAVSLSDSERVTAAREEKAPFGYLLATGGADGWVHFYGCPDPSTTPWTLYASLDHSKLNHFAPTDDQEDKPQIYALQFIDHWKALPGADDEAVNSFLLTSSDDHIHLWELDAQKKTKSDDAIADKKMHLREVMSIKFGNMHGMGYGVSVGQVSGVKNGLPPTVGDDDKKVAPNAADAVDDDTPYRFGGSRNPQNLVYVFDASYCQTNGLLGVALSDGTLRILNGRGVCLSLLQVPDVNAHLTSFAWDATGTRLATCVATGHVITWGIEEVPSDSMGTTIHATCSAIFGGGHDLGRPLFGTRYWGNRDKDDNSEELLLSWGVDGRLCVWDSRAHEEIGEPLAVLVHKPDYPIYAVETRPNGVIALGGGGSEGGFVGVPAYLYDVPDPIDAKLEGSPAKKVKS